MRILQVTLGFYPAQSWGGPEKIVHQNSKELINRGHEVTIYCTNLLNKNQKIKPGTFEQYIDGIRVVYMDAMNFHWWPGTLGPVWMPDLPRYLKREINHFDVIHLNGYRSPMMLTAARAARMAGIPIVTQPHGTLPVLVSSFFIKRLYDAIFGKMELKGISLLIALQESERLQALKHGVPVDHIDIIPNGIDISIKEDLPEKGGFRERFGISPENQLILFLGRINKIKGTDMLVEAFSRIDQPNCQLVIVGPDDGQLEIVDGLIRKNRLEDKVFLIGLLTGPDVLSAYQDSDLFVLPSRSDSFPTTIMEACLMDTPMVITDRCEMSHLVKDRVAEVVPFDVQAFADAMKLLLNDSERYQRYKSNCRAVVADTFSIHAVVDRLEAAYNRVISERGKK